jgi:hypothetical protein
MFCWPHLHNEHQKLRLQPDDAPTDAGEAARRAELRRLAIQERGIETARLCCHLIKHDLFQRIWATAPDGTKIPIRYVCDRNRLT